MFDQFTRNGRGESSAVHSDGLGLTPIPGTGLTKSFLQSAGAVPELRESWKNSEKNIDARYIVVVKNLADIPSSPEDALVSNSSISSLTI